MTLSDIRVLSEQQSKTPKYNNNLKKAANPHI